MADTSIRVSEELADELYQRKGRGTSYEDFLWGLLERVDKAEERGGGSDRSPADTPGETSSGEEEPRRDENGGEGGLRAQIREELAGSGDRLEARVGGVLAMYDHLREYGEAEKDELLDVVDVDATGYESRASVWSNMVKGKDTLRALPGVEKPSTGRSKWQYTGGTRRDEPDRGRGGLGVLNDE
jgi:hypothetical protein